MRSHHDSPLFRNKPWLLMGDFNEILDGEEHSDHSVSPVISPGMREFQDVVNHCNLMDMGSHGPLFTWVNKRDDGLISKILDRVLNNDIWLHRFSRAYCVFESGGCSDHLCSRLQLDMGTPALKKPFKFVNSVASLPVFIPLFLKKLKGLKQGIRDLTKDRLGDLVRRSHEAHLELCAKQAETLSHPTIVVVPEEAEDFEHWQYVAGLEENLLKHRSKLHWLHVGDQNNRVFHNAVKIREARNSIREIHCADGFIAKTQDAIKHEAARFFSDFLGQIPSEYEGATIDSLEALLPFRCTATHTAMLVKDVSDEEISSVLFSMPPNKSSGPDGYMCEFYKSAWPIINKDFTIVVQSFFALVSCRRVLIPLYLH
ncbi:PREDICTED: uncharacterized protein LOC104788901 [Camelina sativa]|uniref:Uncharacterized protein LOC104788901 n=1 Tax=Camelina sativa TaxID=90675 RepID=A0ABM0ZAZ3_CAMSA|nr:PREDICTED: uncharacterized protein LOC104788901 [Camelina sativa]